MNAPDLHPEELLDKAARGALSDGERASLELHLAACPVCRFERAVRADFAAAPHPALDVESLVTRALSGAATRPAPAPLRRRSRGAVLLAAAVALVGVSSFAAVWTGALPRLVEALVGEPEPVPPPRAALNPRPPTAALHPALAPAPDPVAEATPTLPTAAAAGPEPVQAMPAPAPLSAAARAVPVPLAGRVRVDPPPVLPLPAPPTPSAAELFARGNDARIGGQTLAARAAYAELLALYPTSPEAWVTRATYGRMLLDSGDAGAADEQLTAYLSGPDGTLREEALAAHAIALQRLNRPEEEAATWRLLLRDFPDSLHATRAHARLREMK
jgi:hypothetical protein